MNISEKLRKELRFVTSAEQMIPFLNRIRATNNENNDCDDQSACDANELVDPSDELSTVNRKSASDSVPPAITATGDANALPNIYEEYVNFIDLSVLNPIIDATSCQPDALIESEISELFCCFSFLI